MSIPGRCGNCRRELLLDQLLDPSEGFRCPFCGFAFAPSYATIAPGVASRILASHDALVPVSYTHLTLPTICSV